MLPLLFFAFSTVLAQSPSHTLEQRTFKAPDGSTVRYGLAVPGDYAASRPRPLVVALHPGGGGAPFYGDGFMRSIFLPGLRDLAPIMIAPDVPGQSWTDARAEQAVVALVNAMLGEFAIDRRRVLVVGFSMGGRGAWYLSARHPDRFTAAIVMAGRSEEPLADLAKIPTYVIHSRDDQVVPFDQAENRVRGLERMGRPVRFDALVGVGHHEMRGYLPALQRGGRWVHERWMQILAAAANPAGPA
jgi:predicted peptidase